MQYGADGSATDVSDSNPLPIDDAGGSITVDGTVTANLSATDNAVLDTIETNTDFGAVVGGGVEATALRVTIASDSTGVVSVDDGGGALTVDGTVTANLSATDNAVLDSIDTSLNNIETNLGGTHTDDAAFTPGTDDGVPIFAMLDDTSTDSVDEGDAGVVRMSSDRIIYVQGDGPLGNKVNGQATMTASTANTSVIAAQGAGIKTYITDIIVTNTSATDSECIVKDGTTELFRIPAPANSGAVAVGFRSPVGGTANTAINAAAADSISSLYCFASGFTSTV